MAPSFSKFGHTDRTLFSTAEAISTQKVVKYRLTEMPRFCRYFQFLPIHSVEPVSNFVICYSKLQLLLKIELDLAGFPLCVHKKFHATRYETRFLCGNPVLITFYSDSWAIISYQTWFHLTINALNALKLPEKIHHSTKNVFYYPMARQRETIHDKMPKPKFGLAPWVVDLKSKLSRFVYIRGHVTLQVQSNAEKVNSSLQL